MNESNLNDLCRLAAIQLSCNWNEFEIEYVSDNSIMVRLDSNKLSYLIERK